MAVALMLAVTDNNANIVEALIGHMDAKAVNQRSLPLGRTLLHAAVRNDNPRIARMLLEAGADVNAITDDDLSALHIAIGNRSIAMMELLLEHGAEVNPARKFHGRSPLYMAVEYNCDEIVEMLLERGAQITDSSSSSSALHLALAIGTDRIAEAVTRHASESDVNAKSQLDGKTPLHLAIEHGRYEVVRQLIKRGANVDESYTRRRHEGENGERMVVEDVRTPLTLAVRRGDDKIVALLLRCGARSLAKTCLQQAVRLRCKKIAELLLARGAVSVDCRVDGKTALQLAVECGYKDMAKVCLSHGACLDDLGRKTVVELLHEAVQSNDVELAELLLKRGAPINEHLVGDVDGKRTRALDLAVKARHISMSKLLLKHGALIDEASPREEQMFALKYAVLALAEGHKIQRDNRRLIRADKRWTDFYEICREELKRAKTQTIVDEVTFFDLLTGSEDSLASYARRDELVRIFPLCGYRDKYKVYADTLALNYAKGRLRNALLHKATADFEKEFGVPLDSARYVFRLMSNDDLQAFIRTFCECGSRQHRCLPEIFVQF